MTVFSPSLPPVISMTTSTLSLPAPPAPAGPAAFAVSARNCGTTVPRARSEEPRSVWARKSRRWSMGESSNGRYVNPREGLVKPLVCLAPASRQLRLRHGQNGVGRLAGAPVQGFAGGVAPGDEGDQLVLRGAAHPA